MGWGESSSGADMYGELLRQQDLWAKEKSVLTAELERAQTENKKHREALSRFLTTVNPTGYEDGVKAEEAFEQALQCVIADREVRNELERVRGGHKNQCRVWCQPPEECDCGYDDVIDLRAKLAAAEALNRDIYGCLGPRDNPTGNLDDDLRNVIQCHIVCDRERDALHEQVARLRDAVKGAKLLPRPWIGGRHSRVTFEQWEAAWQAIDAAIDEPRCPLEYGGYPCVLQLGHVGSCQRIRNEDIPD